MHKRPGYPNREVSEQLAKKSELAIAAKYCDVRRAGLGAQAEAYATGKIQKSQ